MPARHAHAFLCSGVACTLANDRNLQEGEKMLHGTNQQFDSINLNSQCHHCCSTLLPFQKARKEKIFKMFPVVVALPFLKPQPLYKLILRLGISLTVTGLVDLIVIATCSCLYCAVGSTHLVQHENKCKALIGLGLKHLLLFQQFDYFIFFKVSSQGNKFSCVSRGGSADHPLCT